MLCATPLLRPSPPPSLAPPLLTLLRIPPLFYSPLLALSSLSLLPLLLLRQVHQPVINFLPHPRCEIRFSNLTFAFRRHNVPLQSSRQGDSCELRFSPDQTGPGFKDSHRRKQSWTGKDQVRSCVQCLNLDCLVWLCG